MRLIPINNALRMNWMTSQRYQGANAIAPAGGEITVFTEYLQASQFNAQAQAMRFKIITTGTSAVGNVIFRIKVGSVPLGYGTRNTDHSSRCRGTHVSLDR